MTCIEAAGILIARFVVLVGYFIIVIADFIQLLNCYFSIGDIKFLIAINQYN